MTGVIELLGFGFVRRALVAGVLIAIGCGGMGVFLVLRRYAMIGDGLSHVAFGTVGLALLLGWAPLYTALPLVALASLAIMELPERTAMYGDAAIAMVSAAGIALGVLLASLGGGFNVDLFGFLFGDILAIHVAEVWLSGALVLVIGIAVALQYYALLAVTFDESAAVVLGLRP